MHVVEIRYVALLDRALSTRAVETMKLSPIHTDTISGKKKRRKVNDEALEFSVKSPLPRSCGWSYKDETLVDCRGLPRV